MKLKHRSIRVTFFAAISIIALVFIGILVLLNVFFYQDYYMMTRRSELRDAYGSICTSYASDSSDVAALLDSYETPDKLSQVPANYERILDGYSGLEVVIGAARPLQGIPETIMQTLRDL